MKNKTIDDITGKPGSFKKFLKKQAREAKQAEARRKQRIKKAREHKEVFEGYGVIMNAPSEKTLLHGNGMNPFFSQSKFLAEVLADGWKKQLKSPLKVVKLKAEFKVI